MERHSKKYNICELYDLLIEKYRYSIFQDLYLFDDKETYIICEQKKILWQNDFFIVICLFDSHPVLQFKTKEEVFEFLHTLWKMYYNLV